MREKLTDKQKLTLSTIKQLTRFDGYPPTIREIASKRGVAIKTVADSIVILEKKGYITKDKSRSRSIKVVEGALDD